MQAITNNNSHYQANRLAGQSAYWPLKAPQRNIKTQRQNLLQNLMKTLIDQLSGSSEPRVWSTQDANNQTVWNAQDSASESVIRNASETELRIWLEERYTF